MGGERLVGLPPLLVVGGRAGVCVCVYQGIFLERCIARLSFAASFISTGSVFKDATLYVRSHVESVFYTVAVGDVRLRSGC